MPLTLVVPGLLWPRQVMQDTLYDADYPALQTLLGKGRQLRLAETSADAWWSSYFGLAPEQFAAAPLRLAAAGQDGGAAFWLCADPVHLETGQHGTLLKDPALLRIDAEEAAQLHAALAPLFAEVGELAMTTPAQWHLRLTVAPPALPARLQEVVEQSAVALLPPGDAGRRWRQLINEAQMCLHAHPLNAERMARGQTPINSIALWGGGQKPAPQAQPAHLLMSDEPIVAGAGRLAGLTVEPLASRFTGTTADCTVYWDRLQAATSSHDALAWREGLQQFDSGWLAPALAALGRGELAGIELHGFGDEEAMSFSMTARDRYRFWRKARRLETL